MSFTNQFAAFMGMKFLADAMRRGNGPVMGHAGREASDERHAKDAGGATGEGPRGAAQEEEARAGRHLSGYDPVPRAPVIVPASSFRVIDGDTLVVWPGKYRLNRNWRSGKRADKGSGDRRLIPQTMPDDAGLWGRHGLTEGSARDLWVTHEPVKVRFRSVAAPEITWSLNRSSMPPKEIWGDLWEKERAARLADDPGDAAARALTDIIHGKSLCIAPAGIDRYGRLLADVFADPGFSVEHALLDTGLVTRFEGQDLPTRTIAGMPSTKGATGSAAPRKKEDRQALAWQAPASRAAGPYDPPPFVSAPDGVGDTALPAGIYDPF